MEDEGLYESRGDGFCWFTTSFQHTTVFVGIFLFTNFFSLISVVDSCSFVVFEGNRWEEGEGRDFRIKFVFDLNFEREIRRGGDGLKYYFWRNMIQNFCFLNIVEYAC